MNFCIKTSLLAILLNLSSLGLGSSQTVQNFSCLVSFRNFATTDTQLDAGTVLPIYDELLNDLGSELKPADLQIIAATKDPFHIPESIEMRSSSLRDSLSELQSICEKLKNYEEIKFLSLKRLIERATQSNKTAAKQNKSNAELRTINWKYYTNYFTLNQNGRWVGTYCHTKDDQSFLHFKLYDTQKRKFQSVDWMRSDRFLPAAISPKGDFLIAPMHSQTKLAYIPIHDGKVADKPLRILGENLFRYYELTQVEISHDGKWVFASSKHGAKFIRFNIESGLGELLLPTIGQIHWSILPTTGSVAVLTKTFDLFNFHLKKAEDDFINPLDLGTTAISSLGTSEDGQSLTVAHNYLLVRKTATDMRSKTQIDIRLPKETDFGFRTVKILHSNNGTVYALVRSANYDTVRSIDKSGRVSELFRHQDFGSTDIALVNDTLWIHSPTQFKTFLHPAP